MKQLIFIILVFISVNSLILSQRIIFQSDFETIAIDPVDSIPTGWIKYDADGNNSNVGWAVRDTSCNFGGNTRVRTNNYSRKSLEIPWYAGNGGNLINDDWVFTDSFTVQTGDSLIFWMLIGSDSTFQPYLDSMKVYLMLEQDPGLILTKLATIVSNDSAGTPTNDNVWTQHKFNLSSWSGQKVYVAFRYHMNISVDGLWCNIDDMFIGNRGPIGIEPINNNVPVSYDMKQNYPNPFNPVTNIEFDLPKSGNVRMSVFNAIGEEVKVLVDEFKAAGSYRVDFDASGMPSGTYFYRIISGDFVMTKKMTLVK
jgi:hypothetical protein